MDLRKVKKIMDLLEQSDVAEIEIHEGRNSIRISRINNQTPTINYTPPVVEKKEEPLIEETFSLTSPMVGTFYLSASPTSLPFISIGQRVNKGDTFCIIEAMKIMNKIEADKSGVVQEILCEDGDNIDYAQDLVIIK